jgi:hypothetical protein
LSEREGYLKIVISNRQGENIKPINNVNKLKFTINVNYEIKFESTSASM